LRRNATILNGELVKHIATLGHGQSVVVADAGLPIPPTVPVLDLAVRAGLPGLGDVLQAIACELAVDYAEIACEMRAEGDINPDDVRSRLGDVRLDEIPHTDLKARLSGASLVVRTGECTPYANVVLYGAVAFEGHGDSPST
jgi:D-ribose pyranase